MNRSLLEKPFEPEQIRRRGRDGLLDYVEGHSVIQRLNDALDAGWSFEITHHEVRTRSTERARARLRLHLVATPPSEGEVV